MSKFSFGLILIFIVFFLGCTKDKTNPERSFYMGTTPFPADFSMEEVNKSYDFINQHCDIVSQHINEGIPYEEFYNLTTLPLSFVEDINFRKSHTSRGKDIFLSLSALKIDRVSKDVYYKNSSVSEAIKSYWESLSFDNPKVITAYVNYTSFLIDQFNPVYINYGVESNSATWNSSEFSKYKTFLSNVYQQLKIRYPHKPLFISFMVDNNPQSLLNAKQLIAYTDFIGLSAYPYGISNTPSDSNPQQISNDFFQKYIDLAPQKPLAIAETGYIAEDLTIPAYGLSKQGTQEWQNAYLEKILNLCQDNNAKLLIWFCSKDYDNLLNTLQNQGYDPQILNLMYLWRDTGFINENDEKRTSYYTWLQWMNKVKSY